MTHITSVVLDFAVEGSPMKATRTHLPRRILGMPHVFAAAMLLSASCSPSTSTDSPPPHPFDQLRVGADRALDG